ncbi:hypothetical protein BTO06_08780 [Tenacibaculum sp. SZ-18]|uniref:hypothetical protein n=1 Tax=Tenacibaculum sp. SZ-18 TaxID=754423 RepID=UPI000C2CF8A4|nr:hypothetical protein [Tenacibaculum sp. SZ-18]AUC15226.1 hypothetical protein BTO06_08780 [Tenacibaculum sp. SZ-18]
MKIIKFSIILATSFLLSCKKEVANSNFISAKVTIKDSLKINYVGLIFEEKSNKDLLFFNPTNYEIVRYNLETNTTNTFNKAGDGFDEYTKIYKNFITFRNDSVIAVSDIKSIKQYNLEGEFLGDIKFDTYDDAYAPLTNLKFYGDSLLIAMKSIQGNPSKKEYYKENRKVIFVKNLNTGEENNFINFPEELNDFFEEDYYYNDIYSFADLKKEKSFHFVNSNGKKYYEYNILENSIKSKELPNMPYYNILKLPYGKEIPQDEMFLNLYRSSTIREVFKDDKSTFVVYGEAYDREFLIEFKNKNKGFPFTVTPNINYSLFRFNEKGDGKLYRLNSGKNLYPFFWDENEEEIFMLSLNNEYDEMQGVSTIYIGKLN